jgi:hypothetical protein
VILFCGSLNTLSTDQFYSTLRAAMLATQDTLIFNFLSSSFLAGVDWLTWHRPSEVLEYVRRFSSDIAMLDDYTEGDCTICVRRGAASDGGTH